MLGIGLGGFATGFEKGIGIAEKLNNANKQRALDDAVTKGRGDYDAAVAAGEAKPDDADAILRFTMPKIMTPLMAAGDMEGAQAASEWMRSDTTRQATDLFGKGMVAAQAGDTAGALTHFVKAGRVKGYGPDMTLDDPQPIEGGGYRVNGKTKDGRTFSKDFKTPDDVIQFGATNLNPAAAFQTWQEERTADKKATRDVSTDKLKFGNRQELELEYDKTRTAVGLDTTTQQTRGYRERKNIDVDDDRLRRATGIDPVSDATRTYQNRKDIDRQYHDSDAADDVAADTKKYKGRKDVDLDHETRQRAAGLGPANYEPQNVVRTGPDGKPVVKPYVFDKRKGTAAPMRDDAGNDVDGEVTKPNARGGGGAGASRKPFQFEVVRDAYKALGYSEKDATDIATGQKPPKDTDLITIARQMTSMEMPASDMRFSADQRRKRAEELLGGLREQYKRPAAGGASSLPEPGAPKSVQQLPTDLGGVGTRTTPFQASSQGHVDWFKQNAQPGQVIIIDGKKYTK